MGETKRTKVTLDTGAPILPSQAKGGANELGDDPLAAATNQTAEEFSEGVERTAKIPQQGGGERPEWLLEKFTSVEEQARAYAEAQKLIGGKQPEAAPEEAAMGLTAEALDKYAQEFDRTGTLSEASQKEIEKLGIPQSFQQTYMQGVLSMAREHTERIYKEAGGEENYRNMVRWAADNLSPEEVSAYNRAIDSGDIEQAKLAMSGLAARFAGGDLERPKKTVRGRPGAGRGLEPFRSVREYVDVMKTDQFKKDPAFQKEVEQRIAISNL